MNPLLDRLNPYPFQRLRQLFAGVVPNSTLKHVDLSIGEPKHPTPNLIKEAITAHFDGLAQYPATLGSADLRESIADWLAQRYGITRPDAAREILPVIGSREALFSFVQAAVDTTKGNKPIVISPNPFYQIYEGATLLAGAEPYYVNCLAETRYLPDWRQVPESVFKRTQVVFVCSPGNPTGAVMNLDEWRRLFELSDRYGFIIASDECYSEIWFNQAPLGGLEAASKLGRDYQRLVVFSSLSKRSNAPGLRSGFVAGDAAILSKFLLYRTYHGSAMSATIQAASAAAWRDEAHVVANRAEYKAKFEAVLPLLSESMRVDWPDAAFYLWAKAPARYAGDDAAFAKELFEQCHVTVLPGSYLARDAHGVNPGAGRVRIALVAPRNECIEGARRIAEFAQ